MGDCERDRHLHGACAGSQPDEGPPPGAGRSRRLVGRNRELAELAETITSSSLTTVTGPGGVGKTTLALAVAAESSAHFPDGVFVVWLASLRSPDLVAGEVAAQVGMQRSGGHSNDEAPARWLADRDVLLVLDNCEHVVSAVAELVEDCSPRTSVSCCDGCQCSPGGFDLTAVNAIFADDGHTEAKIADLTARLVEKSLLLRHADTCLYQLLETIRQYSAEQLALAGELDLMRDRHARFYLQVAAGEAEGLNTGPERPHLEVLRRIEDNLRVASDVWLIGPTVPRTTCIDPS